MNKRKVNFATGFTIALLFSLAAAHAQAGNLSYSYVEGSYYDVDIDDTSADGDGFGIAGSVELTDMFHLFGRAIWADLDGPFGVDLDFTTWEVGGGISFALANQLDLVGRASYVDAEVDVPGFGSGDDDGYRLYGGLRGRLGVPVELEGGVAYTDLDDSGDDTSLVLAGRYYFTDNWALGLSGEFGDDVTVWGLNLRWQAAKSR